MSELKLQKSKQNFLKLIFLCTFNILVSFAPLSFDFYCKRFLMLFKDIKGGEEVNVVLLISFHCVVDGQPYSIVLDSSVSWHYVMALCHDIESWHCAMALCHGTVSWHCHGTVMALCHVIVSWHCVMALTLTRANIHFTLLQLNAVRKNILKYFLLINSNY